MLLLVGGDFRSWWLYDLSLGGGLVESEDVDELVQGIVAVYRTGDRGRLDAYSSTRLPRVWRAVEFSHWMLQMLLAQPADTAAGQFHEGLRDARLTRLMEGGPFAQDFAVSYVGIDQPSQ